VKSLGVKCPVFFANYLETLEKMLAGNRDVLIESGARQNRFTPFSSDRSDNSNTMQSVVETASGAFASDRELRSHRRNTVDKCV